MSRKVARKVLITHTDLDAMGCALAFSTVFPFGEVYYSERDDRPSMPSSSSLAKNILDRVCNDKEKIDLYIADIDIDLETAILLDKVYKTNNDFNLLLLDHHKDKNNLAEKFDWCIIPKENNKSGAMLLANHLYNVFSSKDDKETLSNLDSIYNHIVIIDDYDRWIHNTGKSYDYNNLYNLYSKQFFLERLLMNKPLTEEEGRILNAKELLIEDYLSKTEPFYITDNVVYAYSEQNLSRLGNYLINKYDKKVAVMFNMRNKIISMRGCDSVDLVSVSSELGGGGHKSACGAPISNREVSYIIKVIEDDIKRQVLE